MKKNILNYLAGLCQAASAALMASAIIMPEARTEAVIACALVAGLGLTAVIYNSDVGEK